jgi:hypothetical protein
MVCAAIPISITAVRAAPNIEPRPGRLKFIL